MADMSLNIEQMLGQKLTNEQQIMWNCILQDFPQILNNTITPVYYNGLAAGSEFLTYNASKLYICYTFVAGRHTPSLGASGAWYDFYDHTNALKFNIIANNGWWNVTTAAPNFYPMTVQVNNILFSRCANNMYQSLLFIGYRVAI